MDDYQKLFSKAILEIIQEHEKRMQSDVYYPNLMFDLLTGIRAIRYATNILNTEPTVLQINTKTNELDFVIVGDIHGSLNSLIRIFKEKGYPPKTRYLFLGDYVDRGEHSCEVMFF